MADNTFPARRVPMPESGDINEVIPDLKPGDYVGPYTGYTGDRAAVSFIVPGGETDPDSPYAHDSIRHVTSPPHVFTEQEDGSLEIRESILSPDTGWHGYLDAGNIWRVV